jgi:hypothetical protein
MQRIQDSTASPSLPSTPALSGPVGFFTPGSPGIALPTIVKAWWANMMQEELMNLLAAAGIAPDTTGTNFTQVLEALRTMRLGFRQVFGANGSFPVPGWVTKVRLSGAAGGAGGGGGSASGSGNLFSGGGGGSGASCLNLLVNVTPGAVIPVSVGLGGAGGSGTTSGSIYAGPGLAGGATSFGSLLTLPGGQGGGGGNTIPGTGSTGGGGDGGAPAVGTFGGQNGTEGQGSTLPQMQNSGFNGGAGGLTAFGVIGGGGRGGFANFGSGTTPNPANGLAGVNGFLLVEW